MLDLYSLVLGAIRSRIRSRMDIPHELKEALINSDIGKHRVKLMAENMCDKIKTEVNWVLLSKEQIEVIVWSFTDWFIYAFKHKSDMAAASEFDRIKAREASKEKFSGLDDNGNGYVEELGVKVVDSVPQD